ncbi:MAG: hypothetical protein U9P12_06210, partial [Verrucomicrobiota bacterium]|nr:hypothetical protein [Verrucomicrobiota bacterium]
LPGDGSPRLAVESSNGGTLVSVVFNGVATTNHVLQSCGDLASNVWSTVSTPFSVDTNWVIQSTNSAEFFRAIAQ